MSKIKKIYFIVGLIMTIVLCFYFSYLFNLSPGETYVETLKRWEFIQENPFKFKELYGGVRTILWIWIGILFYLLFVLYMWAMQKTKMPGKEYGTTMLISPEKLSKRLSEPAKKDDPYNILIIKEKQSWFLKFIEKIKHRKDD